MGQQTGAAQRAWGTLHADKKQPYKGGNPPPTKGASASASPIPRGPRRVRGSGKCPMRLALLLQSRSCIGGCRRLSLP